MFSKGFEGMSLTMGKRRLDTHTIKPQGYCTQRKLRLIPFSILIAVIMAHAIFIFITIKFDVNPRSEAIKQTPFYLSNIPSKKTPTESSIELPNINNTFHPVFNLTPVDIEDISDSISDSATSNTKPIQHYELPDKNAEQFNHIFDPRLRKKLLDSQAINERKNSSNSKIFASADGRTFIDRGNGNCMVSMNKIDAHERKTNWGFTGCGKSDSEKSMDNIAVDLEKRK
jgi:hypothetical protein